MPLPQTLPGTVRRGPGSYTPPAAVSVFAAVGTPLHIYDMNTTDGFAYVGGASPAVNDTVSDFIDTIGDDDLVAPGGQLPTLQQVNGKWVARFTHGDTMTVSGITDLNHANGFTVAILGSIAARTGTPATSDAVLNISDGTDAIRLEAGNTSTFLANWNNTNVTDLTDTVDLVGGGPQWFVFENDDAGGTITSWVNESVRDSDANTTQFGASCSITLGLNLSMDIQALCIYQGKLSYTELASLGAIAAAQQSGLTLVSNELIGRNTAVPTFTGTEQVGFTLSGSAGSYAMARNATPSLTYQWYNNTDAGNATGTGNATINYTCAAADDGDTLKLIESEATATLTTDSANTGTIAAAASAATYVDDGEVTGTISTTTITATVTSTGPHTIIAFPIRDAAATISSATLDGNSMTVLHTHTSSGIRSSLLYVSGAYTAKSLVITMSGDVSYRPSTQLTVISTDNISSYTPVDVDQFNHVDTPADEFDALTNPDADGLIIAMTAVRNTGATITWSEGTEIADLATGGGDDVRTSVVVIEGAAASNLTMTPSAGTIWVAVAVSLT